MSSLVMDYLVKTEEDWLRHAPLLKFSPQRIKIHRWGEYECVTEHNVGLTTHPAPAATLLEKYRQARAKNKFMFFVANGPFENARNLINPEDIYLHLLEKPDWMANVFNTFADLVIQSHDQLEKMGMEVDGIHIADDIAYKNGMLFSPQTYRDLLMPCHKRLFAHFRAKNLPIMFHTDGKLDQALPLLMEAGITAIQPLEARAGNDVRTLKPSYGKNLVFVGNIDVEKISGTKKDIEDEIRGKIVAAKENGGYLYHSDHSVPPTVSFKNYTHALETVRKYGSY
ncbi:MAG: uroporphyrinogen decarboxylase family protein [Verrucomicrobiae bacterium]|nr:uroporphyrinogen decarboxylase family protein [Verrucomicrobiae bacterium]